MAHPVTDPPAAPPDDEQRARRPQQLIGTPFRRVDGRAKVTGQTRFADDLSFPGMVHVRLVRSTVPHARIRAIDFSAAEAMPGVVGTLTRSEEHTSELQSRLHLVCRLPLE